MVDIVSNWTPQQQQQHNLSGGGNKSSSTNSQNSQIGLQSSPSATTTTTPPPTTPTTTTTTTTTQVENAGQIHPLENEWVFWYDKRQLVNKRARGEKENYENNLRPLGSFHTVEDFWRYYNHMVKPSKMDVNANYHLFKKDIKPMWEDSANSKGGKWILTVKGGDKNGLDTYWENLVLALVGETLDQNDDITGAVVSRRKAGDRCAIWTKNRDDKDSILNIGKKMRSVVGIPESIPLHYQNHEDSILTGQSYTNPTKYSI